MNNGWVGAIVRFKQQQFTGRLNRIGQIVEIVGPGETPKLNVNGRGQERQNTSYIIRSNGQNYQRSISDVEVVTVKDALIIQEEAHAAARYDPYAADPALSAIWRDAFYQSYQEKINEEA